MSAFARNTAKITTQELQPATAKELLDREEARAIQEITDSVQRLGDDLCAATDLRAKIRRHPFLAVGLSTGTGVFLGCAGGSSVPRILRRILSATSRLVLVRALVGRKFH